MKRKDYLLKNIIAILFIFLSLNCIVFAGVVKPSITVERYSAPTLKSEIDYYNKETLANTQVTIRKDIMTVTERNLSRPDVDILSDTFTLPGTDKSVTFPSYPSNYIYNNISSQYQNTGYSNYYKYMLLRQGMYLIQETTQKSADGTLTQRDLKKHPAVDAQFGPVASGNNAVTKEIIIDASYRSLHTTGLYLPAGELVTVNIEGLKQGESISLVTRINNSLGYSSGMPSTYFADTDNLVNEGRFDEVQISSQYNNLNTRLPFMQATFSFNENKEYKIGNAFGGILHINVSKTKSPVKMTISGCVETPHYILGVTTPEYFEEYLRNAPGVQSCLDTENGILVGNDIPFRKIDDVENIAMLWHSFFAVNETFTGGPYNANNLVKFDVHVPAGAAVHLGGGVSSCPLSWYPDALNYEKLLTSGAWGVLHEIGHGNGSAYGTIWGLGGSQEGEVRNNALTVLAYINFLDLGTSRSGEHGEFANAYRTLSTYMNRVTQKEDYNNQGYFEALSTYANLMHSFGTEKFYDLLKTYENTKSYNDNKRADFIIRCASVYGFDFRWYFNTMYKCNVENSVFTQENLDYFNTLKEYVPIASDYQSGIDGNFTSGNIIVSAYNKTTFNLREKTISPMPFEIVSVSAPTYGTLSTTDNEVYTYTPPTALHKRDNFSFVVKQFNGVEHTIDVSLILNHNVSTIQTFANTNTTDIDLAIERSKSIEPTITYDKTAGISKYNAGILLKTSQFAFLSKENKTYNFYLKCDDATRVMVSLDNINFETVMFTNQYTANYTESVKFNKSLSKNQILYFKVYNVNFGGQGFAEIGYKNNANNIVNLPIAQVFAPHLTADEIIDLSKNDRVQQYFVSYKGELTSSLDSNKSDWQVICAPNHQNGNTFVEEQWEDGVLIETITRNKTEYLLDGDASTIYHSIWNHSGRTPLPHEYTIDTQVVQPFNFYQISTRKTANALIKKYALYISSDNINYSLLSEGDNLTYNNYVATIKFQQTEGRYLKLLVYTTSGSNSTYFSIISEIDAGVLAEHTNLIPLSHSGIVKSETSESLSAQNDEFNSFSTNKQNTKIKFAFSGDIFSLYATKGKNMGTADVYIDNVLVAKIDLNSNVTEAKKMVFHSGTLSNSNHIVEIITTEDKPFVLNFIGLSTSSQFYEIQYINSFNVVFLVLLLGAITFSCFALHLSRQKKKHKK